MLKLARLLLDLKYEHNRIISRVSVTRARANKYLCCQEEGRRRYTISMK